MRRKTENSSPTIICHWKILPCCVTPSTLFLLSINLNMVIPVPHSGMMILNKSVMITSLLSLTLTLSLHMIVVDVVTHLFLHCFTFHVCDRSADSLGVKWTLLHFMLFFLKFHHVYTFLPHTRSYFGALLLWEVFLHLLHAQLALHDLLLAGLWPGAVHHLQVADGPLLLHHLVTHLHDTLVLVSEMKINIMNLISHRLILMPSVD